MAEAADTGFMIWASQSPGTLSNVARFWRSHNQPEALAFRPFRLPHLLLMNEVPFWRPSVHAPRVISLKRLKTI